MFGQFSALGEVTVLRVVEGRLLSYPGLCICFIPLLSHIPRPGLQLVCPLERAKTLYYLASLLLKSFDQHMVLFARVEHEPIMSDPGPEARF